MDSQVTPGCRRCRPRASTSTLRAREREEAREKKTGHSHGGSRELEHRLPDSTASSVCRRRRPCQRPQSTSGAPERARVSTLSAPVKARSTERKQESIPATTGCRLARPGSLPMPPTASTPGVDGKRCTAVSRPAKRETTPLQIDAPRCKNATRQVSYGRRGRVACASAGLGRGRAVALQRAGACNGRSEGKPRTRRSVHPCTCSTYRRRRREAGLGRVRGARLWAKRHKTEVSIWVQTAALQQPFFVPSYRRKSLWTRRRKSSRRRLRGSDTQNKR